MVSHGGFILTFVPARWLPWCAAAGVVVSLVSIAASYIFFGTALLLWALDSLRSRRFRLSWPPFAILLLFFCLWFVFSVLFSNDPVSSFFSLKKLIRFLWVPLIFTWFQRVHVEWTLNRIYLVLGASAIFSLVQYYWLMDVDLLHRITGFMSHWMTFSGQLMMGVLSLGTFLLLRSHIWEKRVRYSFFCWTLLLLVLLWSLLATMTRNAWLGVAAGGLLLVFLEKKNWGFLLLLLLAVLLVFLPEPFRERLYSGADLKDTTTQVRLELVRSGSRLVADHPWTGVGPGLVSREVLQYRSHDEFPDWAYQHLHSNILQIAAEIGLVGLVVWILLWVHLFRDLFRMWCQPSSDLIRFLSLNGLCVSVAFHIAGCLEYNFGDSELLILLFFFLTAPYVVAHQEGES